MSNRLSRSFKNLTESAGRIYRMIQGLDPNESTYCDGYTLEIGQTFKMRRKIIPTGKIYLSPGKIIGFRENGAIVVI